MSRPQADWAERFIRGVTQHRRAGITCNQLSIPAFGSDSPRACDDTVVTSDGLEGEWQCLGFELNGDSFTYTRIRVTTYRRGAWVTTVDGGVTASGSYKAKPITRSPPLISKLTKADPLGRAYTGIYRIDGDIMLIVLSGDRDNINFGDKKDLMIEKYRRVK